MFSTLSLRARLTIVVIVALAGMAALVLMAALTMRGDLLEGRKALVRNGTQAMINQLVHLQQQEASGKLTREEAQARAKDMLRAARYGGENGKSEYFYAYTMEGISVMHPVRPEFEGTNRMEMKDSKGEFILKKMLGGLAGGAQEAFVMTSFPRPGSKEDAPKLQFVHRFEPWNWMIGTGIYLDDVETEFREQLLQQLLIALFPLGLVALICVLVDRSVLRQLGGEPAYTVDVVQKIAAGQLNTPIRLDGQDPNSLLVRVAEMQRQLRELIAQIRESADSIGEMAETVSARSSEVSNGSVSQSDAAAAMAAAVTEMTESIHQIADSADRANQLSLESGQLSREGSEVISRAMGEMNRISEAVHQTSGVIDTLADKTQTITSIVNVIHDVADQTNLLALNAAIEAARAGEQGRGFAVVADEVRKLAERTSTATREIAAMISDIQQSSQESKSTMEMAVQRVESGVELAGQGGEAVRRIEESAGRVVGVVEDISVALKEQTHANNLVSQQVDRISSSADSNASSARTAAEITGRMHGLTEQLRAAVNRFQV
ncbi:methyl-accepting chemotaxis protein [Chitinimonas taiwanensis]|uniref:Methyl-accepting chemotaxis sensory transducer with Cache sensor n=1 Tax=Chitinimonas taiwanensis DSM 18899 TaxID=1121279 RepID=A0A1K2HII7_9NEIS|nr:methyl-accepting chemotaxis protein [Chitinimonas taiwanensis]SFZ76652.1 methyl-accepting chemotaxis sensory transducer with Cache sensor [Chitinimonas taiwanensis DSM 18899]